ncbi:unnamed protein product, partial [Oppiella nova]
MGNILKYLPAFDSHKRFLIFKVITCAVFVSYMVSLISTIMWYQNTSKFILDSDKWTAMYSQETLRVLNVVTPVCGMIVAVVAVFGILQENKY